VKNEISSYAAPKGESSRISIWLNLQIDCWLHWAVPNDVFCYSQCVNQNPPGSVSRAMACSAAPFLIASWLDLRARNSIYEAFMRLSTRLLASTLFVCALLFGQQKTTPQDFTITLTGDSIITRRLSVHQPDPRFMAVLNAVREGDAVFTNLEILFHNYEAPPAAQSGGTWLRGDSSLLKELQWIGFNLFGAANNHSLDYGIEGLRIHSRVLQEAGVTFAGIGENLGEARAPAYLETARGRMALVSCASTFSPSSPAGVQRPDLRGRPGLDPLRFRTRYRVDAAALAALRKIKEDLKLGAAAELVRVEPDSPSA